MSALKYLKNKYRKTPQDVHFDLKEICKGMETTEGRANYYLDRLNNLTKFIQENPENIINNKRVDADFMCFRGVLRWILLSDYDIRGFELEAIKLKGTIYLALKTLKQQPPAHLTIFDSCLLSSDPKDESAAVKKDEFNIVLSREVDELKILFAAECDGIINGVAIESLDDLELSKLIEIKCRLDKPVHYHNRETYNDFKKLDFWCQSFIASIDTIYLGKRNKQDIVTSIEEINVESLENPESSKKFWNKNVCLERLREFLSQIKGDMKDVNDPKTVFSYDWKKRPMKGPKNKLPIYPAILENQEFLTKDFISFINNLD